MHVAPAGPAHILVVDDEASITDLLSTALRYMGYQVTTAATGFGALEAAATAAPDLVVLDVMLPDIDGFEVCRRLRAARDFVPVIFLSARDTEDDRVTGFVRGGDDYVTKPFSLEELTLRNPPQSLFLNPLDVRVPDATFLASEVLSGLFDFGGRAEWCDCKQKCRQCR